MAKDQFWNLIQAQDQDDSHGPCQCESNVKGRRGSWLGSGSGSVSGYRSIS